MKTSNNTNLAKRTEVLNAVANILVEFKYQPHWVVSIYGKTFHFKEAQFRALQVFAKRLYEESPEKFREFSANIVIYNHPLKTKSDGTINICRDGYFDEIFPLYQCSVALSRELM